MLLLHIQTTTKKMNNNPNNDSNLKVNKENDEEDLPQYAKDTYSSSIEGNPEDYFVANTIDKDNKTEQDVAVNVEGIHNIEDDDGFDTKYDENIDNNNLDIDIKSQSSSSCDIHSHNDPENSKQDDTNKPQHVPLEPSTPEELVEDWERLHHTKLSRQAREFALKVAAIHLDKDDSRGVTVSGIRSLLGCRSINAAEARKDRAVGMGLLVPHPRLKEGKQKLYFLSNYIHVVNERLKRRSKDVPISPGDITFALLKMLSSHKCA